MLEDFGLRSPPELDEPDVFLLPLPDVTPLNEVNLSSELALQLRDAKYLYANAREDSKIPINQKAQVLNSTRGIIDAVIQMQERLYNMENCKKLEEALIETLRKFPDMQAAFYEEYEAQASK